jgi:hypothetical protein
MKTAKRLNDFEAYLGTAMNLILTRMKEEGKDVINLGLGDPDVHPPEALRKVLADACMDIESHITIRVFIHPCRSKRLSQHGTSAALALNVTWKPRFCHCSALPRACSTSIPACSTLATLLWCMNRALRPMWPVSRSRVEYLSHFGSLRRTVFYPIWMLLTPV